jgi:hypothetical protein
MNADRTQEPALPEGGFAGFVRAAAASVTWRKLAYVQLLGLMWALVRTFEAPASQAPPHHLAGLIIISSLGALFITLATLGADEAVNRGVAARLAYPIGLLLAVLLSSILQWYMRDWLDILPLEHTMPLARERLLRIAVAVIDVGGIGGIGMLVYVNRRAANRILAGVQDAERERVQGERRLVESRLAAAQAQVDPQALCTVLAGIGARYQAGAPDAHEHLESLIQELRGALARTIAVDNTVDNAVAARS